MQYLPILVRGFLGPVQFSVKGENFCRSQNIHGQTKKAKKHTKARGSVGDGPAVTHTVVTGEAPASVVPSTTGSTVSPDMGNRPVVSEAEVAVSYGTGTSVTSSSTVAVISST